METQLKKKIQNDMENVPLDRVENKTFQNNAEIFPKQHSSKIRFPK